MMPRTAREVPPPLELSCLNALWTLGKGNVREVQQVVCKDRPLAYTTIMTVLDRLVRKGKLSRRKAGRAFYYSPETPRDTVRNAAIQDLVDGCFDGSETELIEYLARRRQPVSAGDGTSTAAPIPAAAAISAEVERIDTVLL
jgi:predicted transcriptional regulator